MITRKWSEIKKTRSPEDQARLDAEIQRLADDFDKVRPEVRALAERGSITLDEWKAFQGNSWEMELILPRLTNEALVYAGEHLVKNCQFDRSRPYRSYNEAVMGFLAPELLKRFGTKCRAERTTLDDISDQRMTLEMGEKNGGER